MPTIFRKYGFRFFFFSLEHNPIHIHIEGNDGNVKINVENLEVLENHGIKPADLKKIVNEVEEKKQEIVTEWNKRFNLK